MRGFIYFKAFAFMYPKSVRTWVAPRNSRPNDGVGFVFFQGIQFETF
ncbi:hypothetical protein DOT_3631 [Desulfosporosinus sp. OT]|nr:hypothetical protein DOT_3631 [Desulfosporosinus sp. OT]